MKRKMLITLASLLVLTGVTTGLVLAGSASFGAKAEGERLKRMQQSPLYEDGAFTNTEPTDSTGMEGGISNFADMMWQYIAGKQQRTPEVPIPIETPDTNSLKAQGDNRLRITWMGHSSMLIELDGHLILTDPVWGKRTSPFNWSGPARFHEPPISLEDLPNLDAIVISHDHYDHLDYPSILRLVDRDVPFLVPLGIGAHLEAWGVPPERIIEHEWWQETAIGQLRMISTPAQHFSGRGLKRNPTLWTSWAMIGPQHRVWFSGDTGPYTGYDKVGDKFGPFDATMIEVGAWDERWSSIHLGPEAATTVHQQVRGQVMIPVHWGTFNLALHSWDQPVVELQKQAEIKGITLGVPIVGAYVEPSNPHIDPFWQSRKQLWINGDPALQ